MKIEFGASGRALIKRLSSALVLLAALLVTAPLTPASAQVNVVFVDATPSGTGNNGSSWANAYSDLSVALANSGPGSELWVATGTYKPSATDQTASFDIPAGVAVFGGFEGTETLLSQRDPAQFGTILSGEINSALQFDNTENVVVFDGANDTRLDGVVVTGGFADGTTDGGGIRVIDSDNVLIANTRVANSEATTNGGAIYIEDSSVTVISSQLDTSGAQIGGALFSSTSFVAITNTLVFLNSGLNALRFDNGSDAFVTNVTVADNTTTGGAVSTAFGSSAAITNSIVRDNGSPAFAGAGTTATFSNIEGGALGTGNIDVDPLFELDYSLGAGSLSIDTGSDSAVPADLLDIDDDGDTLEPTPDLHRQDRVAEIAVDQGAIESSLGDVCGPESIVFVDEANTGVENGRAWFTAFTDLQAALARADSCPLINEIRIAEGTYQPSATGDRLASFEIRGGLTVTGGYPPSGGESSDPAMHETVLSGDLAGNDNGALGIANTSRTDNSRLVVDLAIDAAAPTSLVNLTIADGHNDRTFARASGIRLSTGRLVGVRIERNVAGDNSSGLDIRNPVGVALVNSLVRGNGEQPAMGVFTASFVSGTTAFGYDIEITNSVILDNEAGPLIVSGDPGGGLGPYTVTLTNSVMAMNGEPITIEGPVPLTLTAINSTLVDNGPATGGQITGDASDASLVLENSILWNDSDGFVQSAAPGVSAAANASTVSGGTISGSIDIDPEFVDPLNGDFRLAGSSDLINAGSNSLIAADTADLDGDGNTTEDVPIDLDGNPRVRNSSVDIGAYETVADDLTVLKAPCVVYDSTNAGGTFNGGELRTVQVAGSLNGQGGENGCIPDDATLALVTITAIDPKAGGNLRLSAAGVTPTGGVVNYADNGLSNSNTVAVPLSEGGAVDIFANGGAFGAGQPSTDVRLTVLAFADENGTEQFVPITPCAAHDSRANQGAGGGWEGPFGTGSGPDPIAVIDQFDPAQGGGNDTCGIPGDATGIVANVVAINPGGDTGFLSISPVGEEHGEPLTNFTVLTPAMNNATTVVVPLEGSGEFQIIVEGDNSAFTETRLVILGYTTEKDASRLVPVDACAAFDTRSSQGATGTFAGLREGAETTDYQISGVIPSAQGGSNGGTCGVPESATAVLLNLVAINSVGPGNLQAYATGTTPTGGVLNFNGLTPAMNNSNAVIVPLSANGELTVNVNGGPFGVGVPLTEIRGVVLGYLD